MSYRKPDSYRKESSFDSRKGNPSGGVLRIYSGSMPAANESPDPSKLLAKVNVDLLPRPPVDLGTKWLAIVAVLLLGSSFTLGVLIVEILLWGGGAQ